MNRQEFLNKIALMSDDEFSAMIETFKDGGKPTQPEVLKEEIKSDKKLDDYYNTLMLGINSYNDFVEYLQSVNKYEPELYNYKAFYYNPLAKNGMTPFQQWAYSEQTSQGKAAIPEMYLLSNELDPKITAAAEQVEEQENPVRKVNIHKSGGSIIDQLKSQLGDSEIMDILESIGLDELMTGGVKHAKNMSIQIVIEEDGQPEIEDDGGHKAPELGLIDVGNKQYKIETVTTEADMRQGLSDRESLEEDKGMLFDFGEVKDTVEFNVAEMKFPIDIIFINDDDEVIKVAKNCQPGEDVFSCDEVRYVLEVNANSGVKEGDDIEIHDCDDDKTPVMKVLAPDGSTQMELKGGERIFSRANTKTLIKMAKRAESSKEDTDYKKLGNKVFKYIKTQDTNTPEYVQLKEE